MSKPHGQQYCQFFLYGMTSMYIAAAQLAQLVSCIAHH